MKVWYVCQSYVAFEYGSSDDFILFSTQEKAEEKFMELVEAGKDLWGENNTEWILDNNLSKMFTAHNASNSEYGSNTYLSVGSYDIDSGKVLDD